jgi:hypothetical protein
LFSKSTARVDSIALECAQCPARRFQRVQGRWDMVEPWTVKAEREEIERVLGLASAPVRRRFAPEHVDPAALGFVPPFAVVQLGARRIEFGTTDPINHARYVRSGDTVALIPDRVSVVLLAPPERFVDRAPFADLHAGLAAVEEAGSAWPAARVQALGELRAERVEAGAGPLGGRLLRVRDAAGRQFTYALDETDGHLVVHREAPRLDYVMAADARLPAMQ